jgi:NAD(P)-dependent dehydrogenase (short-subunit alcohol dehydrogenase family)
MASAKHIGRIVVTFDPSTPPPVTPRQTVSATRSYLVTGGVHGLGLAWAAQLVSSGARHLWLVGRRGVVGKEEERVIASMRAKSANVHVVTCDVTNIAEVRK